MASPWSTAPDPAQEALAIALALRETLEQEGRTAALVTPDRNLARRVAAELGRWKIAIDNSAGRPLAHTSAGAFLCLLAEAAEAGFAPVPLLALLKHPFASLGEDPAAFRARARALDRWPCAARGPIPGWTASPRRSITRSAEARDTDTRESCSRPWQRGGRTSPPILAPLEQAFARRETATGRSDRHPSRMLPSAWSVPTARIARSGATRMAKPRRNSSTSSESGARDLPPFEPRSYPALLRTLAMKVPVRAALRPPSAPRHPGPAGSAAAEFRSHHPGRTERRHLAARRAADPWFSRPMRETLGLEQPERGIGLAAHDFASWRRAARAAHPRRQGGRRAHHRLALAAAADAIDRRSGAGPSPPASYAR